MLLFRYVVRKALAAAPDRRSKMTETLSQLVQRLTNKYTVNVEIKKTGHFEDGNPELEILLTEVVPAEDGYEPVDDYEYYCVIVDGNGLVLRVWDEHQKSCAHND